MLKLIIPVIVVLFCFLFFGVKDLNLTKAPIANVKIHYITFTN